MRSLFALLLLLPLAAQAAAPTGPAGQPCHPGADRASDTGRDRPRMTRLGDLPPAVEISAVLRSVGGCPKPVVLRQRVGGDGKLPQPPVTGSGTLLPIR